MVYFAEEVKSKYDEIAKEEDRQEKSMSLRVEIHENL